MGVNLNGLSYFSKILAQGGSHLLLVVNKRLIIVYSTVYTAHNIILHVYAQYSIIASWFLQSGKSVRCRSRSLKIVKRSLFQNSTIDFRI